MHTWSKYLVCALTLCAVPVTWVFTDDSVIVKKQTNQPKKRSRGQLKEQIIGDLEYLAHLMSALVHDCADLIGQKKCALPEPTPLLSLVKILQNGHFTEVKPIIYKKEEYVSKTLHTIASIQELLLTRVRECLEDSGEGVFTSLRFAEFTQLADQLHMMTISIKKFHDELRNARALLD